MAALPQNEPRAYKIPTPNENAIENAAFPSPVERTPKPMPAQSQRVVDPASEEFSAGHGGTDGADKTEGRIRG